MQRPLLGFDTSTINALRKDGAEIEPLLAAFDAAYDAQGHAEPEVKHKAPHGKRAPRTERDLREGKKIREFG